MDYIIYAKIILRETSRAKAVDNFELSINEFNDNYNSINGKKSKGKIKKSKPIISIENIEIRENRE